jgi:hypothetical protein
MSHDERELDHLDVPARRQLRRLFGEAMDGPPPGVEARLLGSLADARPGRRLTWMAPIAAATLAVLLVTGLLAARHQAGVPGGAGSPASAAATNPPAITPSPPGATALSEIPIPCRLPLDIGGAGAFIDISGRPIIAGVYGGPYPTADPAGHPRLPDGEAPARIAYDWTVGAWLPVAPDWVAPDGGSYAYDDRQGALHVVDTRTGRDRRLNGDRRWAVLAFRPEGVYAGELRAGGSVPSGLWLVNGTTGRARQLQAGGPWQFVGHGAAWALELRPPEPAAPSWARVDDGRYGNTLVRLDLATGRQTTVYAVTGALLRFVGLDAQGDAVIDNLRTPDSPLTIVTGPGRLVTAGGGVWVDTVADGSRTWFSDYEGESVWVKDASGIRVEVFPRASVFHLAGPCD